MYGRIFDFLSDDTFMVEHVSERACLVYAGLVHASDSTGLVRSWQPIACALNLRIKEWRETAQELIDAGFVEKSLEQRPIGEIGAGYIMGDFTVYQIVGFELPERFQRLGPYEWEKVRQRVFERDDFTCQYCHEKGGNLECDHVIPISRGGTNETGNLVTACRSCNRQKRDQIVEAVRDGR